MSDKEKEGSFISGTKQVQKHIQLEKSVIVVAVSKKQEIPEQEQKVQKPKESQRQHSLSQTEQTRSIIQVLKTMQECRQKQTEQVLEVLKTLDTAIKYLIAQAPQPAQQVPRAPQPVQQAPQAPQPTQNRNALFNQGQSLFYRCRNYPSTTFSDFQKTSLERKQQKIRALSYWIQQGGPSVRQQYQSELWLNDFKKLKKKDEKSKTKLSWIQKFKQFIQWILQQQGSQRSKNIQKATYTSHGQEQPLSQESDYQIKENKNYNDVSDQEEIQHLKQQ